MNEAFICDGVRTPIGRYGGALAQIRTDDLGALPIKALMQRHPGLDWEAVDDVVYGCANQAGEDNRNVARMAALLAGVPVAVPGCTINRLCGSGMDAINIAARAIKAGEAQLMIAGGVESMTRAPFVMGKADSAFSRTAQVFDTTIGWRFVNKLMKEQYGVDSMPETADNVAAEFGVSRADQDAFALRSQQRWARANAAGRFGDEIVPVAIPQRKGEPVRFDTDEHPRPETTIEALAKLKGINKPELPVTPGNASGVNDGAAALIVASADAVKRHGLTPIARVWRYGRGRRRPPPHGLRARTRVEEAARAPGTDGAGHERAGAERGLCQPGAGRAAGSGGGRRRRTRQSQRWRDRAWTPARDERRSPGADGRLRVAPAAGPLRLVHDVHRRRPRHRDGDRAGVAQRRFACKTCRQQT